MGTGYTYTCGCKDSQPLMVGSGKLAPKLCAETWTDMQNGKYGEMWKRAVTVHPNGGLDCSYEIYVCDCGHWERDYRRTLWQNGDRNHSKSRFPRNKAIKPLLYKSYTGKFRYVPNASHRCLSVSFLLLICLP